MPITGRKIGPSDSQESPPEDSSGWVETTAETMDDIQVGRSNDWVEPKPLDVKGKNPDKAYRWCRKNDLDRKRWQGWIPTRKGDVDYVKPTGAPSDEDTNIHCNELILCEMSKEKHDARKAYFAARADALEGSAQRKVEKDIGKGSIYGKIEGKRSK